jgi:UDP-N-acetylglucosamine 2-epimerase (non-hydrolysing)
MISLGNPSKNEQPTNELKIAVVLGTRPEIIKMSPIIKGLMKQSNYFILHTGQHYSYNMDRIFFEQLQLPAPKYSLEVGSGTHAEETAKMLVGIETVLVKEKPDVVLVEGDTNSVLAGALASSKCGIKVGHVEAGLRSYDRSMPEEINRVVCDHLSDYLFAPTETSKDNLLKEGIDEKKVFVTGNTIVDVVHHYLKLAEMQELEDELGVKKYFLLTLHRQENVDDPIKLKSIVDGLDLIINKFGITILLPIHPRSKKRLKEYRIRLPEKLRIIEPIDYLKFLKLESKAELILTDSGGVQEEACILGVPCVTLRDNTERPETIEVGANVIAGTAPKSILQKAELMISKKNKWENPFGDGKASERILRILY